MDEYFCPHCGAILNEQYGFDSSCGTWKCTACGELLMDDDVYEGDLYEGIAWFCDDCGALLNRQSGFSDSYGSWVCTECGHSNGTTEDDIINEEDSKINSAEWVGTIVEKGMIGLAAAAIMIEQEEERKRREKRKAFFAFVKKNWKEILLSIVGIIFFLGFVIGVWYISRLTPVGHNNTEFIGCDYESVVHDFELAGFTNIETEAVEDLGIEELAKENTVFQVYIKGQDKFTATSKYPKNSKIIIRYHTLKQITVPISSKEVKGMNYECVIEMFEQAGFVNIKTEVLYDVIIGWITEDGEVKSVVIDNDKRFDEEEKYRPDVEIVITYHTYKRNEE